MSWAARRKASYIFGIILFFAIVLGGPLAYWFFSTPPTCSDGVKNQGETDIDKGGPCLSLDARYLQAEALLWARSFKVRDGTYNTVAYVQNPNKDAGVASVRYRFSLYDADNVLIAEKEGASFIMPGAVTPILDSRIDTGNRIVVHTYFEFLEPLKWERMSNTASVMSVSNKQFSDVSTSPRLSAKATNESVADILNASFVAVVFDPAGNAFAASQTSLARLPAGETDDIVFTWPDPFSATVGRIDILPLSAPAVVPLE